MDTITININEAKEIFHNSMKEKEREQTRATIRTIDNTVKNRIETLVKTLSFNVEDERSFPIHKEVRPKVIENVASHFKEAGFHVEVKDSTITLSGWAD